MVHTRATDSSLVDFDPEVDRTFHSNSRTLRQEFIRANMGDETRTLRELTAPDLTQQPLAVRVPALGDGVNFELKSGVINLLPKFHGLAGEDPIMHLSEFHDVCMGTKPSNVTEEQIKMRAFGFTLKDSARAWYYHLPSGTIDTWAKLHKAFLNKYFPAKKANALKKAITNVEQADDETLYDYTERFKRLRSSCPYHGFDDEDLVLYLYNGLLDHERRIIDAACGGSILNLTPATAMEKFQDIAESTRSFGRTYTKKGANAVSSDNPDVIREIAELKNMIKGLSLQNKTQQVKACGICADHFHPTDACPQLQDDTIAEVHAVGGFGPPRPRFENQAQNNYNPRWRDQAEWQQQQQPQYQPQYQPRPPAPQPNASPSTEDMLKTLTQHFTAHVQTTESSIKNMEKQIGQLAQAVTHLAQKNANSLPAQPEVNPQVRNVSAITLRSGKYLGESPLAEKDDIIEEKLSEPNARPLAESRARASSCS